VKSTARWWLLPLTLFACANAGTETGNPPTRNACVGVVCAPCAPPIVLHVTDAATGEAIADVAVDGESACSLETTDTTCPLDGAPYTTPGVHRIQLSAPGYEPLEADVEVGEAPLPKPCCYCGYIPTRADIALTRLPSSG
jgi:hypothetical protein